MNIIDCVGTMLLLVKARSSVPSTSTEDTKMLTAGLLDDTGEQRDVYYVVTVHIVNKQTA